MEDLLQSFYGPNAGYVLDLYERYRLDPQSVDPDTRAFFENWSPPPETATAAPQVSATNAAPAAAEASTQALHTFSPPPRWRTQFARAVISVRISIRWAASLLGDPALLTEKHNISDADLEQLPPDVIGGHAAEGTKNALEAVANLRAMYSGTISYEFDQVKSLR